MSDKQKPKPKAVTSKGYEENSEDKQGLLEAAASVPIKDYSDYEITIETKDEYADALFVDESALDSALNQAEDERNDPQAVNRKEAEIAEPKIEKAEVITTRDFSKLLSEQSVAGTFSPSETESPKKLGIINNRLNDSPARKTISETDKSKVFEQTLEQIVITIAQEEAHAEGETETALQPEPMSDMDGSKLSIITATLKAKGKALSQKVLAKMDQSKAELDEYLGRTLPERKLALEFILPSLKSKKDCGNTITPKKVEKLFNTKGKPLSNLFAKAEQDLAKLSKTPLSNSKRLALLDSYFPALSEKAKSLIAMIERKPSIYDDEKRASMVDGSLNSLKHLITGYKQIYANLYESANVVYGPQRKLANQVAFTLIDCLTMEQLLSVALHARVSAASIKTVNKLYHVLSHYEPQQLIIKRHAYSLAKTTTINRLFTHYQLFGVLDYLSISTAQQRLMHAYLNQHYALIRTIPLAISSRLPAITPSQQLLAIKHDTSTTALFISNETELQAKSDTVYIFIQAFFNQVKKDYVEALKLRMNRRNKHSSPALADSPIENTLPMLSALNLSIRNIESGITRPSYTLYRAIDLKAYSGIDDIIGYNHYAYALQQKGPLQPGQPVGNLPEKPTASKSTWQCAMEDDKAIHLQTIECKLGVPMDIGRLVQFIKTIKTASEDDKKETTTDESVLAVITSIERTSQSKILVIAKIISREFTAAAIQDKYPHALIAKANHQSILISHHQADYWNDNITSITFPDQSNAYIAIAGLSCATNNIQLFHLK